jgi:hypothetical protein
MLNLARPKLEGEKPAIRNAPAIGGTEGVCSIVSLRRAEAIETRAG